MTPADNEFPSILEQAETARAAGDETVYNNMKAFGDAISNDVLSMVTAVQSGNIADVKADQAFAPLYVTFIESVLASENELNEELRIIMKMLLPVLRDLIPKQTAHKGGKVRKPREHLRPKS